MARTTRIATIGPRPLEVPVDTEPREIVDLMIDHWRAKLDQVLPDQPDLIVVPEACDRPADFPIDKRLAYYEVRGDALLRFFSDVARENRCHIVYSAARRVEDETWRNSMVQAGRLGKIFYAECDYLHRIPSMIFDPQSGQAQWRAQRAPLHYCSHSLGPILQITGDRIVRAMGVGGGRRLLPGCPGPGGIDIQVALFETEKRAIIKPAREGTVEGGWGRIRGCPRRNWWRFGIC